MDGCESGRKDCRGHCAGKRGLQLGIVQGEGEGLCMILLVHAVKRLTSSRDLSLEESEASGERQRPQLSGSVFSFFFLAHPPRVVFVCVCPHEEEHRRRFLT